MALVGRLRGSVEVSVAGRECLTEEGTKSVLSRLRSGPPLQRKDEGESRRGLRGVWTVDVETLGFFPVFLTIPDVVAKS